MIQEAGCHPLRGRHEVLDVDASNGVVVTGIDGVTRVGDLRSVYELLLKALGDPDDAFAGPVIDLMWTTDTGAETVPDITDLWEFGLCILGLDCWPDDTPVSRSRLGGGSWVIPDDGHAVKVWRP
jgi:hypothetical protein